MDENELNEYSEEMNDYYLWCPVCKIEYIHCSDIQKVCGSCIEHTIGKVDLREKPKLYEEKFVGTIDHPTSSLAVDTKYQYAIIDTIKSRPVKIIELSYDEHEGKQHNEQIKDKLRKEKIVKAIYVIKYETNGYEFKKALKILLSD